MVGINQARVHSKTHLQDPAVHLARRVETTLCAVWDRNSTHGHYDGITKAFFPSIILCLPRLGGCKFRIALPRLHCFGCHRATPPSTHLVNSRSIVVRLLLSSVRFTTAGSQKKRKQKKKNYSLLASEGDDPIRQCNDLKATLSQSERMHILSSAEAPATVQTGTA